MPRPAMSFALTGDSVITRRITRTSIPGVRRLIEQIRTADIAFTNLEVLPNDYRCYPVQDSGGDHMAGPPWVVDELVDLGFDLFATATNHSLNYGIEGLLETIEVLDAKGVSYAGIDRNLGEARLPVYHDIPNDTVALLSCCSTFQSGQQAGSQRPDMQGRPGINPLRTSTTYQVSPHHFKAVREMAEALGLEQQRKERIELGFIGPPADPPPNPFGPLEFRAGDPPEITRTIQDAALDAMTAWVADARMRADYVIVSLHAHEQGFTRDEPAPFIPEFCRPMIDAGDDAVVGHGPHLLRGMEIYRGRPIFYSLGNFIDQHDLIERMPADAYERFRVDAAATPAELVRQRSDDDSTGFAADQRYWQTVVPTCHFDDGQLARIDLHPVSLGFGLPLHQRGKPSLATGDEAGAILERFAVLSKPFGVTIEVEEHQSRVQLG